MRPLRMTKTLTSGNPAKLIFLFTIPLLIGNLFQQFYNMADTLIVGRTLGVEALAAVGCTGGLMFFILGFVIGFTAGLAIITAQRFGAGRKRAVRRSFAVCILLSAAATVLLTAVSVVFARPVLELLQTPPEILDAAHSYIIIIFWGIGAAMLFNLLSNVIRALGDSRTPLYFLVLACVLNIALDLALILRFGMGPAGAAVATVVSQLVSGLLCTIYVFRKFPMLRLTRADWNMSRRYLWAHIRLALPMGFQASIIAIGAILVQFALNRLGAQAVAAFSAAQKIDMVATLPMMSFGIAMATYVAQNYGARNPLRIRQGVLQCSLMSVGFSIAVAVVNIIWGPELIRLFVGTGEREVVRLHVLGTGPAVRIPLHASGAGAERCAHLCGRHGAGDARLCRHYPGAVPGFCRGQHGEPRRMDRFLRAARHCLLLHEKEARTVHETALSPMLRGRTRIHTPGGITAGGKPSLLRSITADNARRPHHRFPDALNGCGHGAHFFPVVFQQSEGIELQSITFLHIFVKGIAQPGMEGAAFITQRCRNPGIPRIPARPPAERRRVPVPLPRAWPGHLPRQRRY